MCVAVPPAAGAEGRDGPRASASATEPAVGRLNHAGYRQRQHCTMFAIAPDVAVSAAHCLGGRDPDGFHLLFGYARMAWHKRLGVSRFVDLGNDVAALCLSGEAPASLSRRPAAAGSLRRGDAASVIGYGQPQRHLQARRTCGVVAVAGGALDLDCAASPGASGAPVLDASGDVVAVVSRSSAATLRASLLPQDVAGACR